MQKYITITVLLITILSIQYAIVASSGVGEDPIIRKSNEKMSIDWNEASTSASGSYLPPGCKCVDTSDPFTKFLADSVTIFISFNSIK